MINIGIMGGTFNPIHIGHLVAAQEALALLNLDKIIFIPTGNPPHKNTFEEIKPEDRLEMVRLAIKDNLYFEVSDMEVLRIGKTFTYDTMIELHNIYYDAVFHFIIGFDTLKDLENWRKIEEVSKLTNFIVVNRGNTSQEIMEEIEKSKNLYQCSFELVEIPDIKISSTDIRNRVKNSSSIKYLVPRDVEDYIIQKGLYINVEK